MPKLIVKEKAIFHDYTKKIQNKYYNHEIIHVNLICDCQLCDTAKSNAEYPYRRTIQVSQLVLFIVGKIKIAIREYEIYMWNNTELYKICHKRCWAENAPK